MRKLLQSTALMAALLGGAAHATSVGPKAALKTYSDIALAGYEDSLIAAKTLRTAINDLLVAPSAQNLDGARAA
jgi:putative iron-regulated protein